MNYKNQKLINDAISYWSDGTLGVGSFGGEFGFHRLLKHAILELDYDKWNEEERGDERMFLCSLDFNLLESRPGRKSLFFRKPMHSGLGAPPGMIHIWDILMADWRTIKIDDFGRVEIKTVFPTSILPGWKTNKRDSLRLVLSDQDILDKQRSIYGVIHNNFFNQMNPYEKIRLMDEDIKLFGLQKKEEELRLKIKQEIDRKLDQYWKEKEQPEINEVENLDIHPVDESDVNRSAMVESNVNIISVDKKDMTGGMGRTEYGSGNVVGQIENQTPDQKNINRQNVMSEF